MERLFNINDLIKSEMVTSQITYSELYGIYDNYPTVVDTLFKLPYLAGDIGDVDSPEGKFRSICFTHYLQAPYTFWSIYQLFQKGYYLEAVILIRHIFETFIQLRYFHKYPHKLDGHLNQKPRVNFSVMFNEFSPGFYKDYYSKQLSEAAHGFIFKDLYRVKRESPTNSKVIMGSEYNENRATYAMNNTIPLMFGFVNWFDKYYVHNTLTANSELYEQYNESKLWLIKCMESHKLTHSKSLKWFIHVDKYVL